MDSGIGVRLTDDFKGTEVCICYTKRPKVVEDYFGSAKVDNQPCTTGRSFIRNCLKYSVM